jgi:hypothetical protein
MDESNKDTQETVAPEANSSTSEVAQSEAAETAILPPSEDQPMETSPAQRADDQVMTWEALEFSAHEKSAGWYIALVIITIILAAALYLLTRSVITPAVVVISGIILGVYGTHKPKQIKYGLDQQGIRIGSKQYPYDEFRLFIVTPEVALSEVTLIPVKRFMPAISIRYTPEIENKVLNMLAERLPLEERRPDMVDSLMRHIRF